MRALIDKLKEQQNLTDEELLRLITTNTEDEYLRDCADLVRRERYGDKVYLRGLIEISNYCKNDCFYCGIRCSNKNTKRYRLTKDEILACCESGYKLGFRTFVMQGGEDAHFSDSVMCDIISQIKKKYSECAVTLSLGERSFESYKEMFDAGADRYLLRHETAEDELYKKLHPEKMSLENRKKCLFDLKKIGYQVGSGFMVGAPFQTHENLVADLKFLKELSPDMIGIGPYITHKETPFSHYKSGDLNMTLKMVAIARLMFPYALIPATTALGTIDKNGRKMGLKSGANVVMPNLSPVKSRKLYDLYDNKISTDEEAAEGLLKLKKQIEDSGYTISMERGDVRK